MSPFSHFRNILVLLLLFLYILQVSGTIAQGISTHKERKRNVKLQRHPKKQELIPVQQVSEEVETTTEEPEEPPTPPPTPAPKAKPTPKPSKVAAASSKGDKLDGLYPDVRQCYDGIPRKFEHFAKDRLDKRLAACSEVYSNTTSLCHKQCILINLGYILTYTVTIMGTTQRQRRYKIHQKSECGHNSFGQDLLGIDTKIWDDVRAERQKTEKVLYFEKVNELGIRGYDPDPFHMKFATTHGEDITDERLEAQMHICKLFDISVSDVECVDMNSQDQYKLDQLVSCIETALTC